MEVDKDLDKIAEYLSVCLGRDEEARRELAFYGIKPGDITEEVKREVQRAVDILRDAEKDPVERINAASEIVKNLKKKAPKAVGKYVLNSASNRLNEALDDYKLEGGRASAVVGEKPWSRGVLSHLSTSYSLDLFLSEDRRVLLELKKLGIAEVPPVVREVAKKAKGIMLDKRLSPKERAAKAAEVLMEPLLPTYSGDRERREIQELTPEVKGVLWEIANELSSGAY
jgi:hypothetical protein